MKIFGFLILLSLLSGFCANRSGAVAAYGEKVVFSQNAPLEFADFTLTYAGERRAASEKFPRGFLYHDFEARSQTERKTISWSSGTGEIAPAHFEIGGKSYELELKISEKLGKLAENELVVRKK